MKKEARITLFASFSAIMRGLVDGKIALKCEKDRPKLDNSTSRLAFGCQRDHIFPPHCLIPKEVTWCGNRPRFDEDYIPEAEVDPKAVSLFRGLQEVILEQESLGRVRYGAGNLPAMRDASKIAGINFWWINYFPAPEIHYDPSQDLDIEPRHQEAIDCLSVNEDVLWAKQTAMFV